ncbi:Asp-tRNAAsn/Glu-tRNAGln amidotransferase A subunit and related amidase [Globomyces pollinis-pini]|nr:Asp-tRNAAsn/Glu-tRNAGln amidotransferase A subunit and related amidase [Globomyces pollinis-pini]
MSDPYFLKPIYVPLLSGWQLTLVSFLCDWVPGVASYLAKDSGLMDLRYIDLDEDPTLYPFDILTHLEYRNSKPKVLSLDESINYLQQRINPSQFSKSSDFVRKYVNGDITPLDVIHALIKILDEDKERDDGIHAIIKYNRDELIKQAEASTARYKKGNPIGPLDGVPISIKDEMHALPYSTDMGTNFINIIPTRDTAVVKRLRDQGCIIIGKASMHEMGLDVTNCNPHGTPRNPYAINHFTGGSSGGSAASVASGLCPISIGADGGGSIRIPAAHCGVYGLKPTAGRISACNGFSLAPSVGVVGPIASNAYDLALAYYLTAGPNPEDPSSLMQPPVTIESFQKIQSLQGLKIGVHWAYFRDANEEVVKQCEESLKKFEKLGAKIVPIELLNLQHIRNSHTISICAEFVSKLNGYPRHLFTYPTRIALNVFENIRAVDLLSAAKVKTRGMNMVRQIFKEVDVIVTPTSGLTAPKIPPGALTNGLSDYTSAGQVMKYIFMGNVLGIPAVSCPVGYDSKGLPIGLQFQAKWFNEDVLLRLANASEDLHKLVHTPTSYNALV